MTPPSDRDIDGIDEETGVGNDLEDRDLSEGQMELLRQALVEHGKRLAELESKMDRTIEDMNAVRHVVRRSSARMKRIAERLGVPWESIMMLGSGPITTEQK